MTDHATDDVIVFGDNAKARLNQIVANIEGVQADIDAAKADQKEIYAGAKAEGFDVKTLRKAVAERKRTASQREDERARLDLYLDALFPA